MRRIRLGLVGALTLACIAVCAPPAHADAATVNGAGSTDADIAINQWQADVARDGLPVNYIANGDAEGHFFYLQRQSDFAVAALPFDASEAEQAKDRPYRYIPVVGEAVAFMYNVVVDGTRVSDVELGVGTLAAIFTGRITNWDDPRIEADTGRTFPDLPLLPVIRADGTAQSLRLSEWIAQERPSTWTRFCRLQAVDPCAPTASYPAFPGSDAQIGPDGVASRTASENGAITYVADGYAKQRGFPVVSVRNRAGNAVQPTGPNVTAALRDATSLPDGTPVLSGVYASRRTHAYPLSTYEFAIVPITTAAPFTTDKGATLGRFLSYAVCGGQTKAAELGYGALPPALVHDALRAIPSIPGAAKPLRC